MKFKTVSDHREEKAILSGDFEAYRKDQESLRYQELRHDYLKSNPDVGTIIRDGVEIFYRNLQPYSLGKTREFYPSSVIVA